MKLCGKYVLFELCCSFSLFFLSTVSDRGLTKPGCFLCDDRFFSSKVFDGVHIILNCQARKRLHLEQVFKLNKHSCWCWLFSIFPRACIHESCTHCCLQVALWSDFMVKASTEVSVQWIKITCHFVHVLSFHVLASLSVDITVYTYIFLLCKPNNQFGSKLKCFLLLYNFSFQLFIDTLLVFLRVVDCKQHLYTMQFW